MEKTGHAAESGRRVVSAFIATASSQERAEAASVQWRAVAGDCQEFRVGGVMFNRPLARNS